MVVGETVSFCIPYMNRLHDLQRAMPHMIKAATASPPVEIVVLDYNSRDGLFDFANEVRRDGLLLGNTRLVYNKYVGREYYHLAHAWNLVVLASSGEYVTIMGADALPAETYVVEARKLIAGGCVWMRGRRYRGILVCRRDEFVAAGGYDERFEFYGGEDKELDSRLRRRGSKFGLMPDGVVRTLKTRNEDKLINYQSNLTKLEMMQLGSYIRKENEAAGVLVANEGKEWGAWDGP